MPIYRISREYYTNLCAHQREEMLSGFEVDTNGDILIPYEHKGYTCNDLAIESLYGVKAVSMFSGAGGLDIGTQLAGVSVMTSLDIFEDSVKTIKQNSFFKNTLHECGDIKKIDGSYYSKVLRMENPEKLIIVGGPPCQPFVEMIYENIEKLGYQYSVLRINAAEYGILQKRKRVFFLASKKKINADLKQTHGSERECAVNPKL